MGKDIKMGKKKKKKKKILPQSSKVCFSVC